MLVSGSVFSILVLTKTCLSGHSFQSILPGITLAFAGREMI